MPELPDRHVELVPKVAGRFLYVNAPPLPKDRVICFCFLLFGCLIMPSAKRKLSIFGSFFRELLNFPASYNDKKGCGNCIYTDDWL